MIRRTSCFLLVLIVGGGVVSCYKLSPPVRQFASQLPARANGQYAPLDEDIKKQLVMKDSLLQCSIDTFDGKTELESSACRCSKSISDWKQDCKEWLGH